MLGRFFVFIFGLGFGFVSVLGRFFVFIFGLGFGFVSFHVGTCWVALGQSAMGGAFQGSPEYASFSSSERVKRGNLLFFLLKRRIPCGE